MILDIGTEEIGHVEMLATMIARRLETSPVEAQGGAAQIEADEATTALATADTWPRLNDPSTAPTDLAVNLGRFRSPAPANGNEFA